MHGHAPALTGLSGLVGGPRLLDRFTDADGTGLAAHAMNVGAGWTVQSGTWSVQGNQANKTNAIAAVEFVTADAGAADVTAQADVTLGTGWTLGLTVRFQDTSNNYHLVLGGSGAQKVDLYEVNGGSLVQRASATASSTLAGGNTYTLAALCAGSSITASLNGTQQFSYGSASFNASQTRFGLACYYDGSSFQSNTFDNFQVL
jgi:hypothetical protein